MTPRQAALLSVNSCIGNGRYTNLELSSVIKKYKFEGLDKSFFTALFYGTVEKMLTIDYCITKLSSVKPEKMDNMVMCLLRTGIYQILFMDKVPDSAAVNESVELAKRYCPKSSVGYVNAVLRNASRGKEKLFEAMRAEKGLRGISVISSIPEDILSCWQESYGKQNAVKIAAHFAAATPSVTLRVNTLKTTREKMLAALGAIASPSDVADSAICLSGSFPVEELYGFSDGLFFVQDEASQLASSLINRNTVPAGGTVIDVCSCPGGKSFSAAINLENCADIYSFDLHENKMSLVVNGAERLGITSIKTRAQDGRECVPELLGKADAVICDVPCSGLGVIAKKPDIRYKPFCEAERLPEIQSAILSSAVRYLKPGGTLIYSTCTLNKKENEDIVNAFLEKNKGYRLSEDIIIDQKCGMATIFPFEHNTDGFFIAKIIKE
ncbi:MAG: 16S rRNA (cytosine(967)-C(5))-methyltransferase RsmB [Clostridia bacterium]|nr:16S rRNA (cytosine(967)-C(5))-methyltransferase RsmB [Clostridia bacterium]